MQIVNDRSYDCSNVFWRGEGWERVLGEARSGPGEKEDGKKWVQ